MADKTMLALEAAGKFAADLGECPGAMFNADPWPEGCDKKCHPGIEYGPCWVRHFLNEGEKV